MHVGRYGGGTEAKNHREIVYVRNILQFLSSSLFCICLLHTRTYVRLLPSIVGQLQLELWHHRLRKCGLVNSPTTSESVARAREEVTSLVFLGVGTSSDDKEKHSRGICDYQNTQLNLLIIAPKRSRGGSFLYFIHSSRI